jgi:hypothetical protein
MNVECVPYHFKGSAKGCFHHATGDSEQRGSSCAFSKGQIIVGIRQRVEVNLQAYRTMNEWLSILKKESEPFRS